MMVTAGCLFYDFIHAPTGKQPMLNKSMAESVSNTEW